MKNIITEELGYMKYLFGYQRGVVISEQSNQTKTGCIKGNCVNGIGTYKWPNRDVYVGQWKDGVMNGQGTYKFISGGVYVGQYKDGVIKGIGTYTNINGVKSSGTWADDKLNGKSLEDLDKITQSNQTKPKGEIKEHWEDVVKYYKDNKDPNWSFVKREDYETENYIWDRIEVKSTDANDSDSLMRVVCNGDVWFWNKGRGTGSSKGWWEWDGTKPKVKFHDPTKNASGYVQPTDKDWSAVYDDNKVIGLNAKGPLVKDVQQSLILIGYSGNTGNPITKDIQGCLDNPENCDGVYGKSTKEMVKQFQKDNGLSVDGVVGKQTYYAFNDL